MVSDIGSYTVVDVRWNGGHGGIKLILDNFFPTSQKRVKFLMERIIRLDFEHQEEIRTQVLQFLDKATEESKQQWKKKSREYCDIRQKRADTADMVESRKYPIGTPLKPDELKSKKRDLKFLEKQEKNKLQEVKRCKSAFEKYAKNRDTVEKEKK